MAFIPPEEALPVLAGAGVVLAAEEVGKTQAEKELRLLSLLESIDHNLNKLVRAEMDTSESDESFVIWVGPAERKLHNKGKNHILICVLAAQNATISVPGLGVLNASLAAGWNIVDFNDATISAASPGFNALVRLTDESYGNPI